MKRAGFKFRIYEGPPASPVGKVSRASTTEQPEGVTVSKSPPMRDRARLAWVRLQRCCARKGTGTACDGPIEASHHPEKGHGSMGQKTGDGAAISLCSGHHRRWHQTGQIGNLSHEESRAFITSHKARLQGEWTVVVEIGGTEPWIEEN